MFERDVEKFGFVISQFKITSKTIMGNILGRSTNSYHVLVTGKGNCGKTSVIASLCGVTYVESSKGVERTSMVHENDRYF